MSLWCRTVWRGHMPTGPFPSGEGQTISQPFIVALMTDLLEPGEGDLVLEVGTGSGYQAAVLSRLVSRVYSLEILHSLSRRAESTLARLGYDNIECRCGNGYFGWRRRRVRRYSGDRCGAETSHSLWSIS